jgi:anti-sigma regulatory factor (Ser/Thr protein kinase)
MPASKLSRQMQNHLTAAELSLELQNRAEIVVPAAKYVADLIRNVASNDQALRIQLGVQEALQNAADHGAKATKGTKKTRGASSKRVKSTDSGKIVVTASYRVGVLSCSVEDQGRGFDWKDALKKSKAPAPASKTRGRGIFLLTKIFDKVSYNPPGTKVTLVKRIGKGSSPRKRR